MRAIAFLFCAVAGVAAISGCGGSTEPPPRVVIPAGQFTSVSAGGNHACAVDTLSRAWCWGADGTAATGTFPATCGTVLQPFAGCVVAPAPIATTLRFKEISAGRQHSCALTSDGTAYCWGSNQYGQLGGEAGSVCLNGSIPCSANPVQVPGYTFSSISAGARTTCGITTSGVGKCWGYTIGPVQSGTQSFSTTPQTLKLATTGDSTWISIARPTNFNACGTASSAGAACWGLPSGGILGRGAPISFGIYAPDPVAMPLGQAAVGENYACALDADGKAYCWGTSIQESLGLGPGMICGSSTTLCYYGPTAAPGNFQYTMLTSGRSFVCGLVKSLNISRCWGLSSTGAAGNGTVRPYPTDTEGNHPFVSISAGDEFACGITADHNVWCWGYNIWGQLGSDPTQARVFSTSFPIPVANGSVVR